MISTTMGLLYSFWGCFPFGYMGITVDISSMNHSYKHDLFQGHDVILGLLQRLYDIEIAATGHRFYVSMFM
jgi:hypothetical protein